MSQNAVLSAFNGTSIPGKIFILGEYAVLADRPALVAAVGPRFELLRTVDESKEGVCLDFHPRSPVGRFLDRMRATGRDEIFKAQGLTLEFKDPFEGRGGFGASTAQFALLYRHFARELGLECTALGARRFYREMMNDERMPPSGADLIAQWSGGVVCFDPGRSQVLQCWDQWDWRGLLVFSATGLPGRKVMTHDHLEKTGQTGLSPILVRSLEKIVADALSQRGNLNALASAMNSYAEALHEAGLEVEGAHADRLAMIDVPGVLGVKGAGALLSDALLVLVEPESIHRPEVIAAANSRGLRLVADGLKFEAGISCAP